MASKTGSANARALGIVVSDACATVCFGKEVNACLNNEHLFQDPATLRRTMISNEMLARENDGSAYNRLSNTPPQDALVVIQTIAKRRKLRASNSDAPQATTLGT